MPSRRYMFIRFWGRKVKCQNRWTRRNEGQNKNNILHKILIGMQRTQPEKNITISHWSSLSSIQASHPSINTFRIAPNELLNEKKLKEAENQNE